VARAYGQDPEPRDPLDSVIGALYLRDRGAYDSAAYLHSYTHARVPRDVLLDIVGVTAGEAGAGTSVPP
jgi:hypothetical protein